MKIFISFIIFLAIGIFLAIAEKSLAKRCNKTYDHLPARYVFAGVYAAIMAILFFGAYTMLVDQPKGWEYWCMAIAAMGTLANLFLFFRFRRERGNEWVEVLPYTFVAIITALIALAGAAGFWTLFTGFFGRVLFLIYVLAAVVTILAIWYVFAENRQAHDGAPVIVIIGVILAAILVFLILPNWSWFGSKDSSTTSASSTTEVATEDSQNNPVAESLGLEDVVSDEEIKQQMQENEDKDQAKVKQVGFYNLSLQNDGIEDNDFNFGYNRYQEDRDLDWYVENIIADEAKDPAFAAAHMGRTDMNLGTRISGVFYDTTDETACVEQINKVKDQFINDEEYFKVRVAAFQILLRKADKKLVYAEDITDMMYQYPYTTTGVPDVIIKNTEKQKGHIVVFSIKIKGKDVPFLAVRAECGWQPVIKYTEVVKKKTTTTTTTTKPKKDPDPEDETDNKKDKTKGTQGELVGKGTGPTTDTNNGVDADTSSAEETNNTGNQTKEETDKILEEKKEINENQKVGGVDDNTSTTATPAPDKNQGQTETDVDNNGDKGTGNGSADEGAPEVYPVALDENGNQIPNTSNNPSGIWEGDVPK